MTVCYASSQPGLSVVTGLWEEVFDCNKPGMELGFINNKPSAICTINQVKYSHVCSFASSGEKKTTYRQKTNSYNGRVFIITFLQVCLFFILEINSNISSDLDVAKRKKKWRAGQPLWHCVFLRTWRKAKYKSQKANKYTTRYIINATATPHSSVLISPQHTLAIAAGI